MRRVGRRTVGADAVGCRPTLPCGLGWPRCPDRTRSRDRMRSEERQHDHGTLERMGVIRRERRKVAGMQGRGMAVYFINPHVGWNGSLQVRKEAAEDVKQPSLRLVEPAQPA